MMWIQTSLVFFVGFIQLSWSAMKSKDCSPNPDTPCTQYYNIKNDECSDTMLYDVFRENFITHNLEFPGKTSVVRGEAAYKQHPNNGLWYPQVNVTMTPPQNAAVHFLKGFQIIRRKAGETNTNCYILDLSNITWDINNNIHQEFLVSIFPVPKVNPPLVYTFEVLALPKYFNRSAEYFDDSYTFLLEIPDEYYNDGASWAAATSWNKDYKNGEISVTVGNFPLQFNFTTLNYMLYDLAGSGKVIRNEDVDGNFHIFKDVPTGTYQIWISPVDPYFAVQDHEKCLCQSGNACTQCKTTKTQSFNFTFTATTVSSTTTVPPTSLPQTQPTKPVNRVDSGTIAAAVIGSFLGVVAIAVIAWFIYRRRSTADEDNLYPDEDNKDKEIKKEGNGIHNRGWSSLYEDIGSMMTTTPYLNNNPKYEALPKRPKLCLVYEDDHQYHRKVVQNFATFLHQHCQCDVMCAEWQLDAPWVHQDLKEADFVIMVNSEGAFKSYMSELEKRNHSDINLPSTASSHLSSINSIKNKFLHEDNFGNIVMIYFEYTSEQYVIPDICPGFKYKLMKHFNDFLLHVHKLHRAENLARFDLPWDGDHKKRTFGLQLIDSIKEAADYQKTNPNWSVKQFGRMYSHTSDDSRHDSGLQADFSPDQSPESDKTEPWVLSHQSHLLQYLNGVDTVTINTSDIEIQPSNLYENQAPPPSGVKPRPQLSIDPNSHSSSHHSPTSQKIEDTNGCSPDDFLPPDDLNDFDVLSNTVSEQMGNIVDRYNRQPSVNRDSSKNQPSDSQPRAYDRNDDLYFLRIQSGEIPSIVCSNAEVVSLGGESV